MNIEKILKKHKIENKELQNDIEKYIEENFLQFTTNIEDAISRSATHANIDQEKLMNKLNTNPELKAFFTNKLKEFMQELVEDNGILRDYSIGYLAEDTLQFEKSLRKEKKSSNKPK